MLKIGHNEESIEFPPLKGAVGLLVEMKEAGEPIVISINGKARLTIQDKESYQKLLDLVDRVETIEAVKVALEEMESGQGRPLEEVMEEIRKSVTE